MTAGPRERGGSGPGGRVSPAAPGVHGAVISGCLGLELTAWERDFFRDSDPWGFILFGRNIDTPDQIRRLTAELRAAVGREAPVLIDQEGGRVQRLRAPRWRDWAPPLGTPPAALALRFRLIAAELRALGIDADCAPVGDIAGPDTHPFLRDRCYGEDAARVTAAARAVAEALLAGGVLPVIKHLPGHGRATADSHHDLPTVTAGLEELRATDFAPFRALADLPMAMTGHMRFPALDAENPTTFSPAVIRAIREEIGFGGLLMTDDIGMNALSGAPGARAGRALAAGCDVVLHCNGTAEEMVEVAAASGRMGGEAAARAARALAARRAPAPFDLAAAEAALADG